MLNRHIRVVILTLLLLALFALTYSMVAAGPMGGIGPFPHP